MQAIEALRRKIAGAEDLLEVVKTMKVLAAVNIRHYERAVASLVRYDHTVELGLQALLRRQLGPSLPSEAAESGREGFILFGADQGLCGQFNEHIVEWLLRERPAVDSRQGMRLLVVGERISMLLPDAGYAAQDLLPTPTGLAGARSLVQELLIRIDAWRSSGEVERVLLLHNRPAAGRAYRTVCVTLLPLDSAWLAQLTQAPWVSRSLPDYRMDWEALFAALVRQHLFVALYRACVESLASEDASRLAAMQNAERNIQERLDELTTAYHHQRQNTITAELLDIVSGFEAVQQREVQDANGSLRA